MIGCSSLRMAGPIKNAYDYSEPAGPRTCRLLLLLLEKRLYVLIEAMLFEEIYLIYASFFNIIIYNGLHWIYK